MKILFAADVPPDPNSGAAGTELQTIAGLRRLGHEVDEIWATDLGRRIKHGNLHYLLELPFTYKNVIYKKCLNKTYDVIHANQGHCYLAAKEHRESKRPGVFVCRSHGLDDHLEKVLKPWREKLGIRNRSFLKALPGRLIDRLLDRHIKLATRFADGFIVSSSIDKKFLMDYHGLPDAKVACIHQAPSEIFKQTQTCEFTPARLKNLLYIANFNYAKSPRTVASVVNGLFESGSEFNFTWVCRKEDHETAARMLSTKALNATRFVGWTTQEELMEIYNNNGVFLYPPLFDGFGKVFLEAMDRGLCVISTKTGGMGDIIDDGRNGFLVEFDDSRGITDKILYLWGNYPDAKDISQAAVKTAARYTWDRVAEETASFYENLLKMKSRNFKRDREIC